MFDWLKRRKATTRLPEYSLVRENPTRGLPPDLVEMERAESFMSGCESVRETLVETPMRPSPDRPLFTELLVPDQRGLLTIPMQNSEGLCLPVFSTPYRAADYSRVLLASGPRVQVLHSSPEQLARMLRDHLDSGIRSLAIDRCPRCDLFTSIASRSLTTEDVIELWSISKSTELARLDLYLSFSLHAARQGQLEASKDVALETTAHVSAEDPRAHFLLGQIGAATNDSVLLDEARSFLLFLGAEVWERRLEELIRSGIPDFELQTEPQ